MNKVAIAKRYARSFFELAQEEKCLEGAYDEMKAVAHLFQTSPEFSRFVKNVVLPKSVRNSILQNLFADKLSTFTFSFLFFLLKQRKLKYLYEICQMFEKIYLEYSAVLKVKIFSACAMTQHQVQEICQKLKNYFHKKIHSELFVDSALIGGFIVQVEDLIYDMSIRSQLRRFTKAVMTA